MPCCTASRRPTECHQKRWAATTCGQHWRPMEKQEQPMGRRRSQGAHSGCGYWVRKGGASQGAPNNPGVRRPDCEVVSCRAVCRQESGSKVLGRKQTVSLEKFLSCGPFVRGTAQIDSFFHSTSMPVQESHSHELSGSDASDTAKPGRCMSTEGENAVGNRKQRQHSMPSLSCVAAHLLRFSSAL